MSTPTVQDAAQLPESCIAVIVRLCLREHWLSSSTLRLISRAWRSAHDLELATLSPRFIRTHKPKRSEISGDGYAHLLRRWPNLQRLQLQGSVHPPIYDLPIDRLPPSLARCVIQLQALTHLHLKDLETAHLTFEAETPQQPAALPALETLELGRCDVLPSTLRSLRAPPSLVRLNLHKVTTRHEGGVSGWAPVAELTALTSLALDGCVEVTDDVLDSLCTRLTRLRTLCIADTRRLTDQRVQSLSKCTQLHALSLAETKGITLQRMVRAVSTLTCPSAAVLSASVSLVRNEGCCECNLYERASGGASDHAVGQ